MIRLVIVADVRFYRDGLSANLAGRSGIVVVGAISHDGDSESRIAALEPDVVLLDTSVPDGLELVACLTRQLCRVKFIALALAETDEDLLAWAEAGVSGYVPIDASLDEVVHAIESSTRGELYCSPETAGRLLRHVGTLGGLTPDRDLRWARLTLREQETLRLISRGLSNKQIARELGIELATAKNHVHHILAKLQIHSRGDAAALMRRRLPRSKPR